MPNAKPPVLTGRCYCGASTIQATALPKAVTYCHCNDCRRITGAPVAAFAAFDEATIAITPSEGRQVSRVPGVKRTFCATCGSGLTGRYDYLPGTVYVAIGLFDQADLVAPQMHAHVANQLCWLDIQDDLDRHTGSARSQLNT